MHPPVVSFCVKNPSRMNTLLHEQEKFRVHILTALQSEHSSLFSTPRDCHMDLFDKLDCEFDSEGYPYVKDTLGILNCRKFDNHSIGTHSVWYGQVESVDADSKAHDVDHVGPLLYFNQSYRHVGAHIDQQQHPSR